MRLVRSASLPVQVWVTHGAATQCSIIKACSVSLDGTLLDSVLTQAAWQAAAGCLLTENITDFGLLLDMSGGSHGNAALRPHLWYTPAE